MQPIQTVLIAGGTHGNEMTGIHLVREWLRDSSPLQRTGIRITPILANPEAIRLCRRYVEFDLNRAFTTPHLDPSKPIVGSDIARAREIHQQFGPKGSPRSPDLVIDLHNSTANMGISLILNRLDEPMKRISAILCQEFPLVRIVYQPESQEASPYLPSIGKRDITIEVGPQAHGTLRSELFFQTQAVVYRMLDLLLDWNAGTLSTQTLPTPVYTQIGTIDYPRRADGTLLAMIHPSREGQDFQPVEPGSPLFLGFDSKEYPWTGTETMWPCFMGEAAYLEKRIALTHLKLTQESW